MTFGLVKHNNNSISAITTPGSLAQGKMTLIKEQTASSSSSISFVDGSSDVVLDSTYPIYMFKYINIHPATDNAHFQFNFRDGDTESSRFFNMGNDESQKMYNSPSESESNLNKVSTSLISNESRVYKGGSWLDRSYYLDPAQRRFLPEYMTTNFIGFRCAMSYLGESRNSTKPKKR